MDEKLLNGIQNMIDQEFLFQEFLKLFSSEEMKTFNEWEDKFRLDEDMREELGQDYRIPVVFGFLDVAKHHKRIFHLFDYAADGKIDEETFLNYMEFYQHKNILVEVVFDWDDEDINKWKTSDEEVIVFDDVLIVAEKNQFDNQMIRKGVLALAEVEKWNTQH